MLLTPYDEQLALDYTIYMMMGSFFKKTKTSSENQEYIRRLRYRLLSQKKQYELEEASERYFENRILPTLPENFLKGRIVVHWAETKDRMYTAVVFSKGKQQLWVTSVYGGRIKHPVFGHWTVGIPLKGKGDK